MSRLRISHAPDGWLQEEPQEHVRRYTPTAFGAAPVGSMKPILTSGGNCMAPSDHRMLRALSIHPENRR